MRVPAYLLALLFLCAPSGAQVETYSALLSWRAPTQNTDGTPLTDLAGFKIYSGCTQSGQYERTPIDIPDPAATEYTVEGLTGTCYFVATAYNTGNLESDFSTEAVTEAPLEPPGMASVTIEWRPSPPPPQLIDTGLIARYFFDEAGAGQTPIAVLDASGIGTAVDLAISYGDNLQYTERSGNRGINSNSAAGTGVVTASIGGTKFDALAGATECTLEYVLDAVAFNTAGSRVFGLMNGASGNGTFIWVNAGGAHSDIRVNNIERTGAIVAPTGRAVVHVVFDSAAPDDRIRLYVNGVRQSIGPVNVGLNEGLAFSDTRLVAMNRDDGARAFAGTVFYGAVYGHAFTAAEVSQNFNRLSVEDDAQ